MNINAYDNHLQLLRDGINQMLDIINTLRASQNTVLDRMKRLSASQSGAIMELMLDYIDAQKEIRKLQEGIQRNRELIEETLMQGPPAF